MEAIKIKGLTKRYKSLTAVDKLSLEVHQGELFSLLGGNGAGKTTAIKMLSCLTAPTSGDAFVLGKSICKETNAVKSLIAVSPQETAVAPGLSVYENLELMCGLYGFSKEKKKARIEEMTSLLGLSEILKKEKLILIPRVYTNKPRTTGEGYKGIASQPDPEKAPDMVEGLIAVRKMHIRAIAESGLTCADEMLYPENWGYVSDILSYVAIGARSVEDQQHRLTASGLDVPVGMKNPTSGDISVMDTIISTVPSNIIEPFKPDSSNI